MTFKSFFLSSIAYSNLKNHQEVEIYEIFHALFKILFRKMKTWKRFWFHMVKFRKNTICDIVCLCPAFIRLLAHSRIICRPLFDRSDREMSLSRSTSQQVLRCGEPRRLLYSYANGNIKKVFPIGQKYRFIASNLYLPLLAFLSCM